ncbi:hypothetical protein [Solicola gregarius]|uniref:Uncharacterized protein n=1 Tax=Solicola gregarius TaxID=2908642 RepID=A0AA46YLT8_9ACTN|nr:hypothetical protein [Solicola gregarius]UYM05188.1 hypothetical protein L0C25_22140 [Solicola gregarius]
MSRRVRLPGADELFRPTGPVEEPDPQPAPEPPPVPERSTRGSGRVKHDEKMTVYVTADELLEIEHARLSLRRRLGQGVDRGRLVREALALALADLDENGDDSELVRRLRKK